jgi:hypothetical protein
MRARDESALTEVGCCPQTAAAQAEWQPGTDLPVKGGSSRENDKNTQKHTRKRKAFWEARFAVAVANCNASMISRSQHITD